MFRIKETLLIVTAYTLVNCSLAYAGEKAQVGVYSGGYEFFASYDLHIPASSHIKPRHLVVEAQTGRMTVAAQDYYTPLSQGNFTARLNFNPKNSPKTIEVICEGKKRVVKERSISSSSSVYPVIKEMLNKITTQYYKKGSAKGSHKKKKAPHICVKSLPNCKLNAQYSLKIKNYSLVEQSLSPHVLVKTATAFEEYKNKERLMVTATFCTKKFARIDDPESRIKFLVTKKGLREIEHIEIDSTSIWYKSVKKTAEKSAKKFVKLKAIHESMQSKR